MAINELHSRLEYLVSYSSQLIFISCESLSQQQSSLQQFIASQHENTEVAFINGESQLRDSDYRNEIYRQLVSAPLSPNDPLDKQLIQQIPKDSGPILICICAAQHISASLLNELWRLVLKNKDLNKGHHLNVLLFGNAQWTQSAKTNLAQDNQHLPILLSNEIVSSNQIADNLSQSIRQRRARIERQFNTPEEEDSDSIIRKPIFKLVAGLVFIGIFFMLVFWQYPDEINQFIDPQSTKVDIAQKAPIEKEAIDAVKKQDDNNSVTEHIAQTEKAIEEVQQSLEQNISDQEPNEEQTENGQELVTSWQKEVDKQQQRDLQQVTESPPKQEDVNEQDDESKQEDGQDSTDSNTDNDTAEQQLQSHPILSLHDNLFVLQLAAMSEESIALQFIQQHGLEDSHWLYTTQRFGGDWHVVIFKKSFANIQLARQYIAALPDSIDKTVPFAKSVKQIKEELAVSQQ